MKKLKIQLIDPSHSSSRGIGYYARHLSEYLSKISTITLVDSNPDMNHFLFFDLFSPTLPSSTVPSIVTVHDVIPLSLPKLYPTGIRAKIKLHNQKAALKKSAAIITDSLSSKTDISRHLSYPSERIFVTPLAVDSIYQSKLNDSQLKEIKQKYSLPEKYVLFVGGINPNKNLPRLIKATQKLNIPLVLVGNEFTSPPVKTFSFKKILGLQKTHPELKDRRIIQKYIHTSPLIHTPGMVPSLDLLGIYISATVYCQPSLHEGFGLPLLEAMTSGSLIVSSYTGSLPEIYPEGTLSFNPTNEKQIYKTLKKAITLSPKQRRQLINQSQQRAKDFSWEKTAKLTADIYHSVHNSL